MPVASAELSQIGNAIVGLPNLVDRLVAVPGVEDKQFMTDLVLKALGATDPATEASAEKATHIACHTSNTINTLPYGYFAR